MAKLVFSMNQSLDGYVDHQKIGPPEPAAFRHFIELISYQTGMVYGGRMYEIMRYWDDEQPGWDTAEHEFAAAWRSKPKWVISRTLTTVGPNATLISADPAGFLHTLKSQQPGEIAITGPNLVASLADSGLVDEYRIYLHPKVIGPGQTFFVGNPPPLRLAATDRISENIVRLTYVPA